MFNKGLVLKILTKGLLKLNEKLDNLPKKKIKIATEGTYPPYNFKNDLGDLEGVEIDLGNEICSRLEIDCEWSRVEWDELIPGLEDKKYDIVISGIDKTRERESKTTTFTKCYVADYKQFGILKRNSLSNVLWKTWDIDMNNKKLDRKIMNELTAVFKDKTVGVQKSTIHDFYLNHYFHNKIKVITYKTVQELNEALVDEDIDAIFADVGSIIDLMDSEHGVDVMFTGPRFYGYGVGGLIRKEDSLTLDDWNKTIDAMNKDGTTAEISKKWFGRDISLR
jgi:octopine/nopaline transport system substrate-binding protein